MTYLLSSDWHLSDRQRDDYRFGLFPWLAKQQEKYSAQATFVLGDLTHSKDNHSSYLVNRIITELLTLKPPVYILMGNHDCIDPNLPFFKFLSQLDGISFITKPTLLKPLGIAMIPHQPDQASFDKACNIIPSAVSMVCFHQMFDGAIAETGAKLSGLRAPLVDQVKPPRGMWAGDIHRPQRLANGIEYVGAPYHCRFGDNFVPRVVLYDKTPVNLTYPCLRKLNLYLQWPNIDELEKLAKRGDHVKITVEMKREEVTEWPACKSQVLSACKSMGFEVFGVNVSIINSVPTTDRVTIAAAKGREPKAIFNAYCKAEDLTPAIEQAGDELLEGDA